MTAPASTSPARAARASRAPAVQEGDPLDAPGDTTPEAPRARKRWHTVLGATVMLAVAGAAIGGPWWVPRALARLAFFRVRRIEIDGARYAPPSELVARLRVDTTWSVWTDLPTLERRVQGHPLVADARVERHLPSTLRVVVVERAPVAMMPTASGVTVLDSAGRMLPIDPSRVGGVDVPIVGGRDTLLLRVLGALRRDAPSLFARVSEARRAGPEEVRFAMSPDPSIAGAVTPLTVRASLDVTPQRFADLLPVEGDLARRRVRATEIDLRFRDQVIARLP